MDEKERAETRGVVLGVLRLIASAEAQLQYEREVPIANVPAELVEQWFSDHYYPETEWFLEAFTPAERDAMAEFNALYASRCNRLPGGSVAELLRNPDWQEISKAAERALARIGG